MWRPSPSHCPCGQSRRSCGRTARRWRHLRERQITLTHDPASGTLDAGAAEAAPGHHPDSKLTPASAAGAGRRERQTAGRPTLAAARTRVTFWHARKQGHMGNQRVRGT